MFKNCYVHIGVSKTGTTSIQNVFHNERKALKKNGFFYGSSSNHFELSLLRGDVEKNVKMTPWFAKGITGVEAQKRASRYLVKNLDAAKRKDCENLIFSSEFLFMRSASYLEQLYQDLKKVSSNVQFVVYLRHPLSRLASVFQQQVKVGKRSIGDHYRLDKIMKTAERTNELRSLIGKENLIIRPFQRSLLYKSDVVADFAHVVGISDWFKFDKGLALTNESLSAEAFFLGSCLNKIYPRDVDGSYNIERSRKISRILMELRGSKFTPPPDLIEEFSQLANDEEKLIQKYFGFNLEAPRFESTDVYSIYSEEFFVSLAEQLNSLSSTNFEKVKVNKFIEKFLNKFM